MRRENSARKHDKIGYCVSFFYCSESEQEKAKNVRFQVEDYILLHSGGIKALFCSFAESLSIRLFELLLMMDTTRVFCYSQLPNHCL
jgi:hypothetical protein